MVAAVNDFPALDINGEIVSLSEALRFASFHDRLHFLDAVTDAVLVRQAAGRREITVSDDELQQAADTFRHAQGLEREQDTLDWLAARHLSAEAWEVLLEDEVRARKLRETLINDATVAQHFAQRRLSFDGIVLSHLVVGDEDLARELRAQIVDDGADFHALARHYSLDEASRPLGGYLGLVRRAELDAVVEPAAFSAGPGETIGPFDTDDGWRLIHVEAVRRAVLDETTREEIQSFLWSEWLRQERRRARIELPLLKNL
jgi:putative peptide maturation system protein